MEVIVDVFCPECGEKIGRTLAIKGRSYFVENRMLVRTGYLHCPVCSRPYHWHGPTHDREQKNGDNHRNEK